MRPNHCVRPALLCLPILLAACGGRSDTVAEGASGAADAAGTGLVVVANGDFEQGTLEPWNTMVHADPTALSVELDADAGRQGGTVLRLDATGTEPWGGVAQTIDATALVGRQIELSAWVRGKELSGSPALLAVFEGGPWVQPVDLDIEGLGSDFEWQRISTRFEFPAAATSLRFGVLIKGGGVLQVDDVELTPEP
jgi:hypothetical protein